ncbi:MAG: phosphatidate cytidylyltransferase [Gemmataceae bacterium]
MNETRNRLFLGAGMVAAVLAVLVVDPWLAPWYPCLFVSLVTLAMLCGAELHTLAQLAVPRPPRWAMTLAPGVVVAANWPPHLLAQSEVWRWTVSAFVAVMLVAFLIEMACYRGEGGALARLSLLLFVLAYIGLPASFLAQLRWWPEDTVRGSVAVALAIFVPKCGDMAAYGVGRWLGRSPMTPLLSPKKTWEGLLGGLATSIVVACVVHLGFPLFRDWGVAALFGLVVGVAGVMGDLAESLIKRDMRQKDASAAVPGFGGLLDVVDSVLFAAPVAYWWLK